MALVKCPDCGREISATAPSCIQCGRQMVATTVEQTGKGIKAARGLGCLSAILGMLLFVVAAAAGPSPGVAGFGALLLFGGLLTYAGAGLLKWWRHE